jgi:hypothetical protein
MAYSPRAELLENWRRLPADEQPARIARLERPMLPRITKVGVLGSFRVALDFTDATSGVCRSCALTP